MSASGVKSSVRNRLVAIGLALVLITTAVMSYPVFSTDSNDARADAALESPALAGPVLGTGGGGGGG